MAILKCKMCGGDIELAADKTFGTCEFCGCTMTFPKVDDEQRAAAFNRGNHFRRIGEFDKALAVYERIVREDEADAEAHWCCALCRFGIEYVEDPSTYEWMPTCHRVSFDSFLEDVDYLAAVEHSDGITRRQYQKDAAKIAEVQRGILATSQNTEPYDVFICYKESDANGDRTRDSLLAQDIYYQLTEQGRKVFFARITLEDVAGAQYEPYIFAALNSAKVMIVVGTKPEHLSAVWVKNEWSRFLAMMKKDRHKLLLPCYRDMDPYDKPEALSVLQSYDMSKIGFIQDLTRGIAKVLDAEKKPEPVKETVVLQQTASAANTAPLLKRAFMFLEDGEWNSADEYCEKVLDIDPECAQAYLGKLLADLRVERKELLKEQEDPFDDDNNYQKVIRFADKELCAELTSYIEHIKTRNHLAYLEAMYRKATSVMAGASTEQAYREAANLFDAASEHRDAATFAQKCREKAAEVRNDGILNAGKAKMAEGIVSNYEAAIKMFAQIPSWRDADEQLAACKKRIEEIKAKEKADRFAREQKAEEERIERERKAEIARKEAERIAKRNKKIAIITVPIVCVIIATIVILFCFVIPGNQYNDAVALMEAGKYTEAIAAFESIGDNYSDSATKIEECKEAIEEQQYNNAVALMDAGKYEEAIAAFYEIFFYKDANEHIQACEYSIAIAQMEAGQYEDAIAAFEALGGYKESAAKIEECEEAILDAKYSNAIAKLETGEYQEAALAFGKLYDYKDSRAQAKKAWDKIAVRDTISGGQACTIAIKSDGTVVGTGREKYYQIQSTKSWKGEIAISAGAFHVVGLWPDGTVKAVGLNDDGQCNVREWTDIVAISAGDKHTVGLRSDGTVITTDDAWNARSRVSEWTDIVAISAGGGHIVGLRSDGTVLAAGDTWNGQCDVTGWTNIVAISAGLEHTVGLRADGTVVVAGQSDNDRGNVSGWKDIVAISADNYHTVGLRSDGTVVAVGDNSDGRCDLSDWSDIVAIGSGGYTTIGLRSDGTVVVKGWNEGGACNVTGWKDIKVPN